MSESDTTPGGQVPPPPPPPAPSTGMSPSPGSAPPVRQKWPSWKQTLIMLLGGFGLFLSGCFGMIMAFDMRNGTPMQDMLLLAGALIGLVGVLAGLIGCVMLLITLLRVLFGAASSTPPSSSPGSRA